MEVMEKVGAQSFDCSRCSFHGSDYESTQLHMGTIHPEFCDEMDTGGLGKLVFYQKSARLFHCHKCFFTSKMFANVYYHILSRHSPEKWDNEEKDSAEMKSGPGSVVNSEKNYSESGTSEDERSQDEQKQEDKVDEVDENDTLTSWPEKVPSQSSDSEFKSNSLEKASTESPETKDKDLSSDQELLESESSSTSSKVSKTNSVKAKDNTEISTDITASLAKHIPEFSDDEDESPALPDGIPHFSEDEDTIAPPRELQESSDDDTVNDQSRGIEDISEDEMPTQAKPTDNGSEDNVPVHSKEMSDSSEEDEPVTKIKKMMDFTVEGEAPAQSKDTMPSSEEDEPINTAKNIEYPEEEDTRSISENIVGCSEQEETPNVSKNIMEFSEDEDTPALSKDIMEFSEEDTPSVSKGLMEFSEEEDTSPQSKDMPKYLEGNSTPTQSKEYADFDPLVSKEQSMLSEDEDFPPERNSIQAKEKLNITQSGSTPAQLASVLPFSDYSTPSWSRDALDAPDEGDTAAPQDTPDPTEDKDGFMKDEEIMKHVRRAKGKFYCLLCVCRPLKKGPMMHHLITRHDLPSPFVCKTCGKTFLMETHLKTHLASHSKGLFKCNLCNFQTDHSRGFKKHQTHCQNRHKDDVSKPVLDFQEDPKDEEAEL
ncbi:chromosome alignment-maintaining phosphoprotein 1 [Spea bombifrons]|uniref:chromosome alignment-maintaining phosphoprotein 1 n=1 Tax=Spea bombifrons TaxID=233779 RepID=UPI00234BCC20|nr:chromosome alignment-maintaining phosphoprotein 1 [Spea bombifrons]